MFTFKKSLFSEKGAYYKHGRIQKVLSEGVPLNSENVFFFFMIRSTTNLKHAFRGYNCIQNYHLGEVYGQIYSHKCIFTATCKWSRKT